MENKFIIPLRGDDSSVTVTTRMPARLASQLEEIAAKTKRSRSQIIVLSLEYALSRLDLNASLDEKTGSDR